MRPISSILPTRTVATVLLVAMLVLAGCTGGDVAADGADGPTTVGENGGDGDGAASADGADDGDGGDGAGDRDGSGDDGASDGAAGDDSGDTVALDESAWNGYTGNLESVESYTVRSTFTSSEADGSGSGESVVKVDGDRAYQRFSVDGDGESVAFEYYHDGDDTVYSKFGAGGSAFYRAYDASDAPINSYADPLREDTEVSTGQQGGGGSQVDGSVGTVPEFRDEGVVQTADGPRHKYVIDDVSQLPAETRDGAGGEITDVYLELLVDEDRGLPTNYVYRVTVDQSGSADPVTSEFTLTYSDFGSTTIEEPDWLDEAKASGTSGYGG